MIRRLFVVAGIAVIVLAGLARLLAAPALTQRLPPGWRWESRSVGISTVPDSATGAFPSRDGTALYERDVQIASEAGRPDSVILQERFTIRDPITRIVEWEYVSRAAVDPRTGARAGREYPGQIYLFPRNVNKTTYRLRNSYLKDIPVRYVREEPVCGLRTYVFFYKGKAEYTECYAGTAEYPGVRVAPGQEICCLDGQYVLRLWVEPVTGEIVKLQEECLSGDYIVESSTGAPVAPLLRWGGVTMGGDVLGRVTAIRAERDRLLTASLFGPGALALAGLATVALGLKRREP